MVTQDPPRRRGRPPAADSAETRAKIFECARHLFGERGYGAVTNKDLAAEVGLLAEPVRFAVEDGRIVDIAGGRAAEALIYPEVGAGAADAAKPYRRVQNHPVKLSRSRLVGSTSWGISSLRKVARVPAAGTTSCCTPQSDAANSTMPVAPPRLPK